MQEPKTRIIVPNGDLVIPEIGMKEVNLACYALILAMLPTNATEMKIEQTGFHHKGIVIGDFLITVTKKNV